MRRFACVTSLGDALKTNPKHARFALGRVAQAAAMSAALLAGIDAWALGLGRLNIQSALGEALRAAGVQLVVA